jgi:integrase/recombinase XerD
MKRRLVQSVPSSILRHRTPVGVLKPTAVPEAFQAWSKRSGLQNPFQGVQCLRHSYAVYLLRSGISLKTIGDLLGHRTFESTGVYLRLAVEDLHDVALALPPDVSRGVLHPGSILESVEVR